jgi:hypothetical protein
VSGLRERKLILIVVGVSAFIFIILAYYVVSFGSRDNVQMPTHDSQIPAADTVPNHARVGDEITVAVLAHGQPELSFRVDGRVEYQTDQERWTECYGLSRYSGRNVCVEYFQDGDVGVITGEHVVTLTELNLAEDDLTRYDEGVLQDSLQFDCSIWQFTFSGEVSGTEEGASTSHAFYGWDFVEQGGRRILCIEKREGEPFEVSLVELVGAHNVRISRN